MRSSVTLLIFWRLIYFFAHVAYKASCARFTFTSNFTRAAENEISSAIAPDPRLSSIRLEETFDQSSPSRDPEAVYC